MDKPKKGNVITIKLNGKDRPYKEGKVEELKNEQNRKVPDDPMQSLLKNDGKQESAAAKEIEEDGESFEWILPEGTAKKGNLEIIKETGQEKDEKKQNVKTPKTPLIPAFFKKEGKSENPEKKKLITTVIVTVFFAILLGTILGFAMLNMVLPESDAIGGAQPASQPKQQEETPVASEGKSSITLPAMSAYVVQEGIYSAEEFARQNQTGLKEEGFPVVVMDMKGAGLDGKFALFVGVSDSLSNAKTLGGELGASGIETFAKEFTIGEKNLAGLQNEEVKFLQLMPQMYNTLIEGAASKTLSNDIQTDLKEKYQKQAKDLAAIDSNKLKNEKIIALSAEMKAAFAQLKIYDEKGDANTRNSLQQHLLASLELYQNL